MVYKLFDMESATAKYSFLNLHRLEVGN